MELNWNDNKMVYVKMKKNPCIMYISRLALPILYNVLFNIEMFILNNVVSIMTMAGIRNKKAENRKL